MLDADQELDYFASHMQTYIDVLGQAYSESEYLSALSDYYGNWYSNGDDPTTAQSLTTGDFGSSFLGSLAQDRGISLAEMWEEFSYSSTCMNLAQDSGAQASYAGFIDALVSELESYDGHNGASALVVVPVSSSEINVINTGDADVTNLSLSAAGETVDASELPAGENETVALEGTGVQSFGATFSVDGISEVSATIAPTSTYLGTPIPVPEAGDPTTFQFSVEDGPFAANGAAPTYSWDYGDGSTATGVVQPPHHYSCYGTFHVVFSAQGDPTTASLSVTNPPPFNVNFTTNAAGNAVAPGIPVAFTADSSIPAGDTISWNFGDGQGGTGRTITHTFASAATDNVTMSISQGSGCQSLTTSQQVTIGRSTDWIALSGTLPPKFEMVSSVAGYILYGTVYVAAGHTLTVDPGANVRFASANGESGQLIVNGTLQANGLSGAPATFTSQNDTSSPSWAGITTTNGGTLNLNYADVRNAQAAVWLQGSGATVNVKNSTLELSGDGLWSEFANAVTVTGTTFSNDGTGAEIDCSGCSYQPALTSDTFSSDSTGADVTGVAAPNLVDTTFTNTAQPVVLAATATRTTIQQTTVTPGRGYVEILGGSFPNGSVNLRSDLPYVISGAATIPTSGEVTVGPGVIVKFASGGGSVGQLTVSGELIASGTPGAEPIFTSAYDDSAGGHCGCVGTGRSPAPGDWYGLTTTGTGGTIELDYADVRYAADGLWLQGSGATVNVSQSTVEDAGTGLWSENSNAVTVASSSLANDSTGMEFDCFGCTYSPSVTSTTFSSDPTGVYVTGEAAPEIHGSSFQPGTIGVLNGGNATVDASANWWGEPSGPAPGGTGATVTGNVKLNPFCVNSSCIVPPTISSGEVPATANVGIHTRRPSRPPGHRRRPSRSPARSRPDSGLAPTGRLAGRRRHRIPLFQYRGDEQRGLGDSRTLPRCGWRSGP